MKSAVFALAGLLLALTLPAGATEEFKIAVALTTGELSKDSNSLTTTITVEGRTMTWEQTAGGSRARGEPAPARKTFTLTPTDREKLLKLVRDGQLLTTASVKLPRQPPVFYFELRVETIVGDAKGTVELSGPRSAIEFREKELYRNSRALLQELYRIMNAHDDSIRFEEPVEERP